MLDTNIVAYLMKGHTLARAYEPRIRGKLLAISFITVGEMLYGAEKQGWGRTRRQRLDTQLKTFTIAGYDWETAQQYARIATIRSRLGRPVALHDAWIAACALRHAVPLVTHNAKDFEEIPALRVITEPG